MNTNLVGKKITFEVASHLPPMVAEVVGVFNEDGTVYFLLYGGSGFMVRPLDISMALVQPTLDNGTE